MTIQYHDQRPEGYQEDAYEPREGYQSNQYSQPNPGYGQYNQSGPQYGESQSYYEQPAYDAYRPNQPHGHGESQSSYQGGHYGYTQAFPNTQQPTLPQYAAALEQHQREQAWQQQGTYGGYQSPPLAGTKGYHSPPASNAWVKQEHSPAPDPYAHQPLQDPSVPGAEADRGFLGALAGGAAGAYGGHKINHGFLGALGGAYAGHKLEDAYKDKKKHSRPSSRRSSSSSSSSSSDGGKYHAPPASHYVGNFSASSKGLSLHGTNLHAECCDCGGHYRWSRIDLNQCLRNSDGHFEWGREGNFGASARHVKLIDGGRGLEAELQNCSGDWRLARVALDERISNNDGQLILL